MGNDLTWLRVEPRIPDDTILDVFVNLEHVVMMRSDREGRVEVMVPDGSWHIVHDTDETTVAFVKLFRKMNLSNVV